ncbi:MmcQ/YjbR family DNA-binding protein [Tropicimonas sp. IMCC34043]|uniref:MmcQ/YjbR family DNA-binding protein n=1 Tax=Tropicimonas sp. IMCC34043 TaxID=2248760 RepID=UPI003510F37B
MQMMVQRFMAPQYTRHAGLPSTGCGWHPAAMNRDEVNTLCAALPGAELTAPFGPGHDIWKVGGKIFAATGSEARGVSVKCADVETAEMLRTLGGCEKAPYFHRSWVLVPFDSAKATEIEHRVRDSYRIIRAALPKKLQATLAS